MSMQVRVAALRQQLELLFPGKWFTGGKDRRCVQTGIPEIDNCVTGGVARKRITEWTGPLSSGKTSILRSAVSYWCSMGLNVAYIDTEGKLYAADWAFVEHRWKRVDETVDMHQDFNRDKSLKSQTACNTLSSSAGEQADRNGNEAMNSRQTQTRMANLSNRGKFWIVRPPDTVVHKDENQPIPLVSKKHLQVQESVWSADQFIRSNAFDVVILDFGSIDLNNRRSKGMSYSPPPWRVYARLQRALDRSKAALIIVSDLADDIFEDQIVSAGKAGEIAARKMEKLADPGVTNNWGCHARFVFSRAARIEHHGGLNGLNMIVPIVRFSAWRDGMSQNLEVSLAASVPNRLFANSQVPDRRSSKR